VNLRRLAVLSLLSITAAAQFKEVGPPPFTPAVAHDRIRVLLEKVDVSNRQQTIKTLTGWLVWYRDILDQELIAAWRRGPRTSLTEVISSLADTRVASSLVEFSWLNRRPATFNPEFARMFSDLMARFPESAKLFRDDLLGSGPMPELSEPEAEIVCRIFLEMPEIGTWKDDARRVFRYYRHAAEVVLTEDVSGPNQDRSYEAQAWLAELRGEGHHSPAQPAKRRSAVVASDPPAVASDSPPPQRRRRMAVSESSGDPGPTVDGQSVMAAGSNVDTPLPSSPPPTPPPPAAHPNPEPPPAPQPAYTGPLSGTLISAGGPIPQHAEYVFRNLPPGKIQLDYDTKIWDAHVAPGLVNTQRVIVKNKSSGPQKRCIVKWTLIP
jgi:hypothetical protein